MSDIKLMKIKTICEKVSVGYVGPTTEFFTTKESGIPFLRSKNIRLGKIDMNDLAYVTKEFHKKNKKSQLKKGDIVIVRVGQNRGDVCKISDEFEEMNVANCVFLRPPKEYSNYLEILLRSPFGQKLLLSISTGSAQEVLNTGAIAELEVPFPSQEMIKYSSSMINSLDDKIELLQQQNSTLETIAQTIFKEWFGKYQVDDELPEGWNNFELSKLVETINGYSYKGSELVEESNEALVTLKSFDRNGGFQTRGFKPFKGKPKSTQEVKIGDLVVAHTDLTQDAEVLGNPAFIFDDGGFNKMYITMDLVKVVSKHNDISSSFLYYLMKDRTFKGHCVGYSNGTTVLHLSKKAIPEYQIFLPTDFKIIKQFTAIADATTNKISLNKKAIKYLSQTRDELLPRLMSGEIRVQL